MLTVTGWDGLTCAVELTEVVITAGEAVAEAEVEGALGEVLSEPVRATGDWPWPVVAVVQAAVSASTAPAATDHVIALALRPERLVSTRSI
jgi:hypothetical protein